jgi:hypothetical protein
MIDSYIIVSYIGWMVMVFGTIYCGYKDMQQRLHPPKNEPFPPNAGRWYLPEEVDE